MIYKQPSGNAGEYYPAFFEMRLKVDHMIDLNTCANAEFALFCKYSVKAVLCA